MKLQITKLSRGAIDRLTIFKRNFAELLAEIKRLLKQVNSLQSQLSAAIANKAELERYAATDPKAASVLSGIDAQLARLEPLVEAQTRELNKTCFPAGPRIGLARETVRDIAHNSLTEALRAEFAEALAPFYVDPESAKRVAAESDSMRILYGFFGRGEPSINSAEDAIDALEAAIRELDELISGRFEVDVTPKPTRPAFWEAA